MSNEQTTKYVPMNHTRRGSVRGYVSSEIGFAFTDDKRRFMISVREALDSLDAAEAEIDRLVAENNRLKADNAQLDRELDATMAEKQEHVKKLVLERRELNERIRLLEEGF